ncbi:OmpA family protein [Pantoea sp. JK]|uniref:OmpA family protein n=1 Tax=Pantoea sp. JK TaxID=2871703 RepID=UPI0022385A9F|nr:OmpA family protein [Pantoea sp. JK]MCW6031662.1 OmpA family protein [Pantoea sp. JK]
MKIKRIAIVAVLASLSVTTGIQAQTVFGKSWQSMPAAASDQTKVVYYRTADNNKKAAHIYVDGEFQTALLSGGYTVFCLKPGMHSLGSYTDDAPRYRGKQQQQWRDSLAAGKTYYVTASLDGSGRPHVVETSVAQQQLMGARQQAHLLSRASSVISCKVDAAQSYDNYEFSSDLLFNFASASGNDISAQGHNAIQQFAHQMKRNGKLNPHIIVTGFTDPIGDNESNLKLGQRRADTIKKLLVNNGLSSDNIQSQSMGESQVSKQCSGSLKQQRLCYASERRVIISVESK